MTDDLVVFLRARLDEDYEAVRLVIGVNVMAAYRHGEPVPRWVPSPKSNAGIWDTNGQPRVKFAWARERDHIIRHDPARVLAEIAAKRAVVDAYASAEEVLAAWAYPDDSNIGRADGLEEAVRILTRPYAGHPEYKEEWRP